MYSVSLKKIVKEFNLKILTEDVDIDGKLVETLGELVGENKLKVHSIRIINKENDNELP